MDDKKNKKPENGRELFYVVITIAIFIVIGFMLIEIIYLYIKMLRKKENSIKDERI